MTFIYHVSMEFPMSLCWHMSHSITLWKAKFQKWQIWCQILSDLPTYLHQISSDVAWHTYLPKNLTSYVNAPEMWQFGTNFMIMIYLWCFRKESNIHISLFRLIFTCMALFKILVCITLLISVTRLRDSMSKHCVIETQKIIPSRAYSSN